MAALRFAQYSFLAAANFPLYSGVSKAARLALYSGEANVAFKRSLRWASAAGSDIFSFLRFCAARIPAMRFASNSGSFPLRSDHDFIASLLAKLLRKICFVDSGSARLTPTRDDRTLALWSGSSQSAVNFSLVV